MADAAGGAITGGTIGSIFGPVGTGIGAGLGGIAGGLADFFGQQSANAQNWDEFVSNQAWNTTELNQARDYNTWMANTAHQREEADLKAAGLNPILAANQGAPSPTSPMSNPGTGAPIQNASAGLGRAISSAIPDAVTAARNIKDIENIDADSTLKQAQALTEVTNQTRNNASAALSRQQTSEEFTNTQRAYNQLLAEQPETAARINRANLDQEYDARERILGQIKTGVSSAKDLVEGYAAAKQPGLQQQGLNIQGLRGVRTQ